MFFTKQNILAYIYKTLFINSSRGKSVAVFRGLVELERLLKFYNYHPRCEQCFLYIIRAVWLAAVTQNIFPTPHDALREIMGVT